MANMALEKVTMPEQDPKVRARNFEEVTLGYTKEMATVVQKPSLWKRQSDFTAVIF